MLSSWSATDGFPFHELLDPSSAPAGALPQSRLKQVCGPQPFPLASLILPALLVPHWDQCHHLPNPVP